MKKQPVILLGTGLFSVLIATLLLVSCSEKKHEPEPIPEVEASITYTVESSQPEFTASSANTITITNGNITQLTFNVLSSPSLATLEDKGALLSISEVLSKRKLADNKNHQVFVVSLPKVTVTTTYTCRLFNGKKSVPLTIEQQVLAKPKTRAKLPIDYVAEYNLTSEGNFATTHDATKSGYFRWKDLSKLTLPEGYHIPSVYEWYGIFPNDYKYLTFDKAYSALNVEETVEVNGKKYSFHADYKGLGNGTAYSIKCKGDESKFTSACRYRVVGLSKNNPNAYLEVTVRPIEQNSNTTIEDIASDLFWNSNSEGDVIRIFPAIGLTEKLPQTEIVQLGLFGYYWSLTAKNPEYSFEFGFSSKYANVDYYSIDYGFGIRPFASK